MSKSILTEGIAGRIAQMVFKGLGKKSDKDSNLDEANIKAFGLCYPFAMEKARKWYADHITVDDSGKRPKVIVDPDRDNLDNVVLKRQLLRVRLDKSDPA